MPANIQLPEIIISPDKLAHIIVYGILTILFFRGLKIEGKYNRLNIILTIGICALYGMLMEVIQYTFFPGRFFELGDSLANLIGCVLAYLLFEKLLKYKV